MRTFFPQLMMKSKGMEFVRMSSEANPIIPARQEMVAGAIFEKERKIITDPVLFYFVPLCLINFVPYKK